MRKSAGFLVALLAVSGCGVPRLPERAGIVRPGPPPDVVQYESPMPTTLSAVAVRVLTADTAKLRPVLEKLSAAHHFDAASVTAALNTAGYPTSPGAVVSNADTGGVDFGVPDGTGCLIGAVQARGVFLVPRQRFEIQGCAPDAAH